MMGLASRRLFLDRSLLPVAACLRFLPEVSLRYSELLSKTISCKQLTGHWPLPQTTSIVAPSTPPHTHRDDLPH
eukprot:scaffold62342_cov54-Phaeocystis_antarctica.AAC.1